MTRTADSIPKISVIMPTLSPERTIELSLRSICNRRYAQERVEILVVDGGSTDRTIEISKAHGAKVLPNPKVRQEFAKHIGLRAATGHYAVFLDSDEVLDNVEALSNRVAAFDALPDVRVVLSGGYRKTEHASSVNDYINIFSDPFAWFMYGMCSDHAGKIRIGTGGTRWLQTALTSPFIASTSHIPCRSSIFVQDTLDLIWAKSEFASRWQDAAFIPGPTAAILDAFTVVAPAFAASFQFARTRKAAVFAHFPLSSVTAALILYAYGMKRAKFRPRLKTYGSDTQDFVL